MIIQSNYFQKIFVIFFIYFFQNIFITGAMLYLVGLGLGDVTDIGLKARSIVEKCERVYLEAYTSILFQGKHEELVS